MATKNIVPRATGEGGIGKALKKWLNGYISHLFATDISSEDGTNTSTPAQIAGAVSKAHDQAHKTSHEPGGADALTVDAAAATGSLRTLGTGATSACAGNDSRLSDARTPTSHASSHQSGGSDAIRLDDVAAPDDNTDLNATTSAHGLLPKLGGGSVNFLRADGTWSAPAGGSVTFNEPAADASAGTQAIFDSATVGESVVFPDLLYLKPDGKWWKADADANATMPGLRMALETKSADQTCSMLVAGRVRNDSWNWSVGGYVYASTTTGGLTQEAPSGSGDIVQKVGYAYHADKIIFDPEYVVKWVEASGGTESSFSSGGITYKVHTFTSGGTFTVTVGGFVDYLVVAGGGGAGGQYQGGGGGAGGLLSGSSAVTAAAYTITVGSGGSGRVDLSNAQQNGGNSSIAGIATAIGGGYGSDEYNKVANSGGSGGGACHYEQPNGGAGTAGQGYRGGNRPSGTNGSGGGGAGGQGTDSGNPGGPGVSSSISGSAVTYAAGGAGLNRPGSGITNGTDAAANTGNGGNGGGNQPGTTPNYAQGGDGGSGIVIIKYRVN
jgi:hypothetical protein